jgi:hypothetical protein
MVNLLTALVNRIGNVYVEKVPQETKFPYKVLKLPESIDTIPKENFLLTVDCWDKSNNNTVIENLADDVISKLDRWSYKDSNLVIKIFLNGRSMIPDPELDIRRRELSFECQVFWLREE